MDNDTVSLSITSFQSTLQHILYTPVSSGTTSGSSQITRSQTLHLAPHCRQQQHLLGWEIGVRACDSSRSGTGNCRTGPGRDCRLDESLIFQKRNCCIGCVGRGIVMLEQNSSQYCLSLAASPEFFRILGGAKLLYTISLQLSSDPLAQQLPDDHSLR